MSQLAQPNTRELAYLAEILETLRQMAETLKRIEAKQPRPRKEA